MNHGAAEMIHLIDVALFLLFLASGLLAFAYGTFFPSRLTEAVRTFVIACFAIALFFYTRVLPLAGM